VRELLHQTLLRVGDSLGIVLHIEKTASVAEARLACFRQRPHLILLDEVLPGEAAHDLLDDPLIEGVAVVLISASGERGLPLPLSSCGQVLGRLKKWSWSEIDQGSRALLELLGTELRRSRARESF
jgi:hypothetical protein